MSKQLLITGLAQETDFDHPTKARTVIVINKGELRIPVDETSVQQILEYALRGYDPGESEKTGAHLTDTGESVDTHTNGHSNGEDSFPDQDDYASLAEEEEEAEESEEVFDDTGISQL